MSKTVFTKKPLLLLYKATAYKKGKDTYVQTSIHNYVCVCVRACVRACARACARVCVSLVLAREFTMIYTKVGE